MAVVITAKRVVREALLVSVAASVTGCVASPPRLAGHYTWGHEVASFQPCGSTRVYWVVGDKAVLQPLRVRSSEASAARGKPYQPIYVEVSGVEEDKAQEGFAADYDGVLHVTDARIGNGNEGCPSKSVAR